MSDRSYRFAGLYALIAAAASFVVAPLLALAYSRTPEGADEFATATLFPGWTERGGELAGGLLTFASADRVYSTYLQFFALLFPAVVVCALAARRERREGVRPLERWGWRVALTGYGLFAAGLAALAVLLLAVSSTHEVVNVVFLGSMFPGLIASVLGSTLLGVALLRAGYEPRLTAWLLALAIPLWLFGSFGLGHNGLGLVPLLVAWAATGWTLWADSRSSVATAEGA